jgi:hypothetical protein
LEFEAGHQHFQETYEEMIPTASEVLSSESVPIASVVQSSESVIPVEKGRIQQNENLMLSVSAILKVLGNSFIALCAIYHINILSHHLTNNEFLHTYINPPHPNSCVDSRS